MANAILNFHFDFLTPSLSGDLDVAPVATLRSSSNPSPHLSESRPRAKWWGAQQITWLYLFAFLLSIVVIDVWKLSVLSLSNGIKLQSHLERLLLHEVGLLLGLDQALLVLGLLHLIINILTILIVVIVLIVFYRTWVRSLGMLVTNWLTPCCLVNLIDVTLACKDDNSNLLRLLL